jgi:hypothetical protein
MSISLLVKASHPDVEKILQFVAKEFPQLNTLNKMDLLQEAASWVSSSRPTVYHGETLMATLDVDGSPLW